VAKGGRVFLDKIFPDHWSFMLGEISLYSFVVLMATGVFLSLYFVPRPAGHLPRHLQAPRGQWVSEAYKSTVNISFGVRGGLLIRQMHHWSADIFTGSIVVHMARIFFTGAFRKPRELNWTIGTTMLILAILEGFIGYSLPDDLISGTGLRIGYSIAESIPFVGSYLVTFLWGGQFPGNIIIPRFFIIHVLIIPLVMLGSVGAHLGPAGAPEAHAVQGRGAHRDQRGGLAHVPDLHGQDHRVPLHGDGARRRCSGRSPRSTRSGSSGRTTRPRSPTPSSRTGTWAGSTAPCASCRRGSSPGGGTPSRSRSSCRP
jgi:ubiquinol-cytochrome c reductase cytochrome b subunit